MFMEAHLVCCVHGLFAQVQMDVGWRFDSVRISRTDARWRYVGRVHEYLSPTDNSPREHTRVPETLIK